MVRSKVNAWLTGYLSHKGHTVFDNGVVKALQWVNLLFELLFYHQVSL